MMTFHSMGVDQAFLTCPWALHICRQQHSYRKRQKWEQRQVMILYRHYS
uniref:Uncharacterized protein n=1 Tax=Arundo donax TaxID=35708 RepID=A0A0A9F376_ARUDO